MLVPMKTLVLLLCLGFATALDCTGDEISCTNGELCIPYQFLCDNDSDCADASDEDPEFCSAWRNTDCEKGQALCRANGASECISIENYCHRTQPACQGTLDRRICSILGDRKLVPFDTIRLPPVNTPGNCSPPYIEVGDQCIAFFSTESITWANARTFCKDSGGHLFIIQNGNQYHNLVRYLIDNKFTSDFWLGGRYELGDLSWVWLDGNPMPLGTPFWSLRRHICNQRNVTVVGTTKLREANHGECYHYTQAPEDPPSRLCAAITYEKHYHMSDEDCLTDLSPLCVTSV